MSPQKSIHIYWFKRDLRWEDNDALMAAVKDSTHPLLLLYVYEPSLLNDPHYSDRHWRFVQESLDDLNTFLKPYHTQIGIIRSEVIEVLHQLQRHYAIKALYSTEETGLQITYDRDIAVAEFCKLHQIEWKEFQNNGVIRARRNRDQWRQRWYAYMGKKLKIIPFDRGHYFNLEQLPDVLPPWRYESPTNTKERFFQKGGRMEAEKWEDSFFTTRIANYSDYISKPELARYGCSRLSPYFAWGCLSIREVYQRNQEFRKTTSHKKQAAAFSSRLRWQSHFIQKFEMEIRMQYEAVNRGYLSLPYEYNEAYVTAWKEGQTGYPLVDACMRSVVKTGYLNFRMRAMVTSFLTHHLFQHFTTASAWLAQQFLDFEPGIHYGQFQMQAGLTGINTVRVYNPTKNALDHDEEATFIKKYLPELAHLPANLAIEPWKMTVLEQRLYNVQLGVTYPERIVDIAETRKTALAHIYGQRKLNITKDESKRVLDKHTLHRTESRFP